MPPIGYRPWLECIANNDLVTFQEILHKYDDKYKAVLMFQAIVYRRSNFVALLLSHGVDPVPFQTYVREQIMSLRDEGERAVLEVIEALLKS